MSCISINLKKEETLVKIEDNATEEEIIGELKIKLAELTKLYQEEKTPIRVTGKILSEQELQDVRNIVKEYLDVQINFNTPTSLGLHSIVRSYKEKIENSDTIFQRGSVRSGQIINAKKNIIIKIQEAFLTSGISDELFKVKDVPLHEIGFSVRVENALRRSGINSLK